MFNSIYRVFPRVFLRVRGILDFVFDFFVHPGRRLGGAGGPAAPFGRVREGTPPGAVDLSVFCFYFGHFAPTLGGALGGGPYKSLLDLLVRTDTEGVCFRPLGLDFKDTVLRLVRCPECGRLLIYCKCKPGKDYAGLR